MQSEIVTERIESGMREISGQKVSTTATGTFESLANVTRQLDFDQLPYSPNKYNELSAIVFE